MIVRPDEAPFEDAAKKEKMIGSSRMLALLLRNSSWNLTTSAWECGTT
jgi:hypothetical protein